jgi:hypothetical protein
MSLYDRAVDIGVRLDAAASADASVALLAQGQILVRELDETTARLEAAASMREVLEVDSRPAVDSKAVNQAVGAFRAGLSRHAAAAFQHAPATTLRDVARQQATAAERWALSAWRAKVDELTPHVPHATSEHLQGGALLRQRAENRLRKLRLIRDINPLTDAVRLQSELQGTDLAGWLETVSGLDEELSGALEALQAERAQHTPAVRAALFRAGSTDGLPLEEVTEDLLADLRAAGVLDQLVVRRV